MVSQVLTLRVLFQSSIHSRTAYVISAVVAAESAESVLTRCERLVEHLHDYPEARDYAIKVRLVMYSIMCYGSYHRNTREQHYSVTAVTIEYINVD